MFDTHGRAGAALPPKSSLEFFRVQLSRGENGAMLISCGATYVDEVAPDEFEMVDQELSSERVPTIEEALALVTEQARRAFQLIAKEH